MRIFAKRSNNNPAQNALPGVFALFDAANTVASKERPLLAGYAAWALFPPLLTFALSFFTPSPTWITILTNAILVLDIVVSTWVGACLTLVGLSRLRHQPLGEKEIEVQARRAMPMLLYLFAFTFFCVILGTYLLVLPGVVAFVWLAFTDVVALDEPGVRFSAALTKSRDLSRGRFFRVFWRIALGNTLFGLAYFSLALLVLAAIFSIAGIDAKTLLDATILTGTELPAWIPLLLSALFLPFLPYVAIYNVALYEALKKA